MQTLPFEAAGALSHTSGNAASSSTTRPATGPSSQSAGRLLYIDNLRWIMIMLVLSMHAAVTYSHLGSWYFMEDRPVSLPETFIFGTYQAWLQSFFMGFLFFIAGYFVPKAYDTKGVSKFLKDRAYRLGLPLLMFVFIIQPVSVYCIFLFDKQAPWSSFGDLYAGYIYDGRWLGGTGPLWFCEALLIFCTTYALFRVLRRRLGRTKKINVNAGSLPGKTAVGGFIALIALCSFLVRIPWPNGTSFYNLQFCYFSQYVFFFSAGIMAFRRDWLHRFPIAMGKYWGRMALIGGMALWVAGILLGGAIKGDLAPYQGGLHWQSLLECCREQLAGVGISIFLLIWFRERFSKQGTQARFFSANAFAVYVFHTPVLIVLSKLMIGLHWPLLLKFILLTGLSILVTYALSAALLRRMPLLKNIL
jgi:glucan biosynthesis protein C